MTRQYRFLLFVFIVIGVLGIYVTGEPIIEEEELRDSIGDSFDDDGDDGDDLLFDESQFFDESQLMGDDEEEDEALELSENLIRGRMDALFKLMDVDKDQALTRQEIEEWIRQVGQKSKERFLQAELAMLDTDHDSQISLNEYLTLSSYDDEETDDTVESLRRRFENADADEDGFVHGEELEVLIKAGKKSEEELEDYAAEVLTAHDVDRNGQVTFEEFIEVAADDLMATFDSMKQGENVNGTSSAIPDVERGSGKKKGGEALKAKLSKEEMDLLREEFGDVDSNKDGVIDLSEIREILEQENSGGGSSMGDFSSPEEVEAQANSIFSVVDPSVDSISYRELMSHLTQFAHSVLTDSGEMLRFPEEYPGLDSLITINGTAPSDGDASATSAIPTTVSSSNKEEL